MYKTAYLDVQPRLAIGAIERKMLHLICIWLIISSVFAERMILHLATGGNGVVQVTTLITPLFGVMVFLLSNGKAINFMFKGKFLVFYLPYIVMTFTLPFLGVLFMDYPVRTLFGSVGAINVLSFIMIGYWVGMKAKLDSSIHKLVSKYLCIGIVLQFIYSLGQYLYRNNRIGSIWTPFQEWDISSTMASNVEMIYGRSSGFFLNPNALGLWAVISFWASILLLTSKRAKRICVPASFLVLVFSQSRGAMTAFIVSIMLASLYKLIRTKKLSHPLKTIPLLLIIIPGYIYLMNSGMIEDTLQNRYSSAIDILSSGVSADGNFNNRVTAWNAAIDFLRNYPFGTLGSPQLMFNSIIDNAWVGVLLQGGFLYLLSFFMLIFGGFFLITHSKTGAFLGIVSTAIGILAMTQNPFGYAPISIFWFFLGVLGTIEGRSTQNASASAMRN